MFGEAAFSPLCIGVADYSGAQIGFQRCFLDMFGFLIGHVRIYDTSTDRFPVGAWKSLDIA
jgi:hypothetical protein